MNLKQPNLSNKHWLLIFLTGVLVFSGYYNLEFQPTLDQYQSLENTHRQVQEELQQLKQYQLYKGHVEERVSKMLTKSEIMEKALPLHWEMDLITEKLLFIIDHSRLQLNRQITVPEIHYEHYAELTIHLEMEGEYFQLLDFVQQLETLSFLVNVRGLDIKNKELTSQEPLLYIQLSLSFYRRLIS